MNIPQKGYYTHYKHDPLGALNNYTYEVLGITKNTEDETFSVLYRPLYQSEWMPPADFQSRPLDMFLETVEKDGVRVPRFALITDSVKLTKLQNDRDQMYPARL